MKFILYCFLIISSTCHFGQDNFNANGMNVTLGDLQTNSFEKDSTANAVILYEYGKSYIDKESFRLTTEIKVKVKILTKDGLNRADIEIPLYIDGNKEELKDLRGTTYNLENGKVVNTELAPSQIFTERYSDKFNIVKFLLPNVKEGSVFTYSYRRISPYIGKYYPWYFQSDLPKLHSEYNTSIPGNYDYHIKLVGNLKLDIQTQDIQNHCLDGGRGAYAHCAISRYIMRNVPAIIQEDYTTSLDNYRSRIEYELKTMRDFTGGVKNYAKTWETADKEFRSVSYLGGQLKSSSSYKKMLPESIISTSDPLTRANLIFKYVQDNYRWNEVNRDYKESVSNLIQVKTGTATAINMLLHNLLVSNDLDAKLMLISTRANGFPTKIHPVITDFNYGIVTLQINEDSYLLDATDPFLDFGELPFNCLNQYGRVLDLKSGSYWMDIEAKKTSTLRMQAELAFNEENNLVGVLKTTSSGYHALPRKKSYFANQTQYVDNLDNKLSNISFSNHKVINPDKSSIEFNEEVDVAWDIEILGNRIYLNPMLFKFYQGNPFKLQERSYPIDFGYKQATLLTIKINLNNRFEVKELPKDVTYNLPNNKGMVLFKVGHQDDELNIYLRFNLNDSLFESGYYEDLKTFFGEIITITNNSFVLLEKK